MIYKIKFKTPNLKKKKYIYIYIYILYQMWNHIINIHANELLSTKNKKFRINES